ncbi:MAG: diacylglycerol/lipid kinase family protein, partial [Chloroflexota bacterium]
MNDLRRGIAVMNPSTGTTPPWRVRRTLERTARRAQVDLTIIETEYADHATEIVRENAASVDVVVAVGGDGTLSEVVAGAVGHDVTVGIIPTGSTNMVAKDLGIPRLLGQAAKVALDRESAIVAVDVARAGDT